jgi:hypothetical protein
MDNTISTKRAKRKRTREQDSESVALRLYRHMLASWVAEGSPRLKSGAEEAARMLAEADPNDAIETMLMQQAAWLHVRMGYLSHYATVQTQHRPMQMLHEAADRAAGACRRHLMALAEYRDPSRKRFTAVKQANFAQQQIVIGPPRKRGRPRKYQIASAGDVGGTISETRAEKISTIGAGTASAAAEHRAAQALVAQHGTADGLGEKAG